MNHTPASKAKSFYLIDFINIFLNYLSLVPLSLSLIEPHISFILSVLKNPIWFWTKHTLIFGTLKVGITGVGGTIGTIVGAVCKVCGAI